MFLNVGGYEILVIAIVALIVVGPEQLPVVMRKIGRYAAQVRRMANGLRQEFMDGLEGTELEDLAKLKDLTRLDTWADFGEPAGSTASDPDHRGRGTDDDPIVPRGFAQSQAALEAEAARTTDVVDVASTPATGPEPTDADPAAVEATDPGEGGPRESFS